MEASYYYNSKILDNWEKFIDQGIVAESEVRPEIARSWQRSRGLDPKKINMYQLPNRILQAKLAENIQLILCARPIMQEINRNSKDFTLLLAENEVCILEVVGSHIDTYDMLGLRCGEKDIGTNAIGISLAEEKALEVVGPEHYCEEFHSYFTAGVPIHDNNGETIGVLGAMGKLSRPMNNILQTLRLATIIIENQLQYKAEQSAITRLYHNTCSSIIDFIHYGLIVVDANRRIINANRKCLDIMGGGQRRALIGKFVEDLIVDDNQVLTNLFSNNSNEFIKDFHLKGLDRITPCTLVRRQFVRNPDNTFQTILGFEIIKNKTIFSDDITSLNSICDDDKSNFDELIGESQAWKQIKNLARKAGSVSSNVLITGESGTGKDLIARAIHEESGRKGNFITINCGAIPKELLQSELFGYEEGAYTGARRGGGIGKLEMADGGTVFLDEIGEMPFDMQVNLLRFIQDTIVTPIGGYNPRKVNVRVIAATNRNLKKEIVEGTFRDDLYYRLSVINIELPPLRKRKLDIPLITRFLIDSFCTQFNRGSLSISDKAMDILCKYWWPGNVRELKNIIENAIVFTNGDIITEDRLPGHIKECGENPEKVLEKTMELENGTSNLTIEEARNFNMKLKDKLERDQIIELIDEFNGNISKVAQKIGLSRTTVYRKMKKYRIEA